MVADKLFSRSRRSTTARAVITDYAPLLEVASPNNIHDNGKLRNRNFKRKCPATTSEFPVDCLAAHTNLKVIGPFFLFLPVRIYLCKTLSKYFCVLAAFCTFFCPCRVFAAFTMG